MCGPPAHSFLEHLHRHQGSVLRPDYKTAFPSFEDALHRLLPYHVYQGALPSPHDYHRGEPPTTRDPACACGGGGGGRPLRLGRSRPAVDEEFETVSTQLLKRTQAMLNKYRLLLLEESRVGGHRLAGFSPSPRAGRSGGRQGSRRSDQEEDGPFTCGSSPPPPRRE